MPFREIETRDVDKAIRTLNSKKDDSQNDIPAKILKKCSSSTESIFQKLFNEPSRIGSFPDKLKLADIALVFKKNNTLEKENYRPVSVLPVVSKIFERIMQKQVTPFTEKRLSLYLCGHKKGFSTQQASIHWLKNGKKNWNKKGMGLRY